MGQQPAAWDGVNYDELVVNHSDPKLTATISAYIDTTTHNARWVQEETSISKLPKLILGLPKGEEQATFTDADFTIKGCTAFEAVSDEELIFDLWN